jgi:hypothetical protein
MPPLPAEIVDQATRLFHDVRIADIDDLAHADFVIARVLDRGTMASVRALLRHYGVERIREFFRGGGGDRVQPATSALWMAYLDLRADECTPRSLPRRSSPFWTS